MSKKLWRRLLCTALCCALALSLTGCAAGIDALSRKDAMTLPPTAQAHAAPTGDTNQEIAQTVLLYVPNAAGSRLIAQTERLSISAARHPAEATLRQLFAFGGSEVAQPLCREVSLQLSPVNPVEISGGTATVNLGASALTLSHGEFYVVCQAIANTLTQWGDIRYVNVLVSSTQPGLDVGANVPMGCFTQNLNDSIDTLTAAADTAAATADRRFSMAAMLYYPAYSGRGILAEARGVSFESRAKPALIETLLDAMSQTPQQLTNVPAVPDLTAYLSEAPAVQEIAVTGGQRAVLHFQQNFNDALIGAGIPRSVMLAAITYTITGFVPGINGITVYIGEELVSNVVPGGVYEGAGEAITFAGDIMRRSDFSRFLLANCLLYFGDGSGRLIAIQRPIPYYETRSARYLLGCLMQGPQPVDGMTGAQAALPEDLSDADLLGVGLDEHAMLLNLSPHFAAVCADLDAQSERLLVYSMVNTLCELPAVRSVSFFIAGAQPETLSGGLYLPGEFLRNGSLVRE